MEFAHDLLSSLRGRVLPGGSADSGGALAWSELHARLAAAHAAANAVAMQQGSEANRCGGFASWVEARPDGAAGAKASQPVNRTDLADGKCAEGIELAIAGTTMTGGRGQ